MQSLAHYGFYIFLRKPHSFLPRNIKAALKPIRNAVLQYGKEETQYLNEINMRAKELYESLSEIRV